MAIKIRRKLKQILQTTPYRFQVGGIRFAIENNGRILLADDMGLGKTLQAIGYIALEKQKRPVVIVCPSSLKYKWKDELWKHARLNARVLEGTKAYPFKTNIVIINYEILEAWQHVLKKAKILVFDECHYLKNYRAKRTKHSINICKKIPHILALSGTPITGAPIEFFPILHILYPKIFTSFWKFAFRYSGAKRGRFGGWDFKGAKHLDELKKRVEPFLLRRLKKDVLTDLPEKPPADIVLTRLTNRKEYKRAEKDIIKWIGKNKGRKAALRIAKSKSKSGIRFTHLRQLLAEGKTRPAIDWIQNYLDSTGEKLVVFGEHYKILNPIIKHFKGCAVVTGKTPVKKRFAIANKFQTDPKCRLFVGNIKAAGAGLDLTAAPTVAFVELSTLPSDHSQAEDRILRIGQKAKEINRVYLIGIDTIETKLLQILLTKDNITAQLLDGNEDEQKISVFEQLLQAI